MDADNVQVIGDKAYIYAKETHEFLLKDFKEENGKVVYKKTLPQITTAKSKGDLSESEESAENKENVKNVENKEKVDNSKKEEKDSKNKENKKANKKEEK